MGGDAERRPEFGALLRRFRLSADLSQEMLAERARISVQAVSALERGVRRAPQRQTLELIVRALDLDAQNRSRLEDAALKSTRRRPRAQPASSFERSNLPLSLTKFFGRARELETLEETLGSARLVTIWGAPGVGKTRLAIELAASVHDHFPDSVRFVDLARVVDSSRVTSAFAAALNISEEQGRDLSETIARALYGSRALIVVDNCEHVIVEAARLIEDILSAAPAITLLCTSREPLRVRGEHVFPLEPLPVSDSTDSPATLLFADRAASAGCAIDVAADRRAIAAICRRLDGIPLAIELTAARTRAMTPPQIARALQERFDVSAGTARTALPRQQTLHGALEWSYGLLSPAEQRLMRRLCVFPGGWSVDDALAVLPEEQSSAVFAGLEGLVDKALAVVETTAPQARYRMLEMTRQYAMERLAEAGELELCERLRCRRHRAMAEHAFYSFRSLDDEPARMLFPDLENFNATLTWAIHRKSDVDAGAMLAAHLSPFFDMFGMQVEGIRWANAAVEALGPEPSAEPLVQAWMAVGRLSSHVELHQQAYDATVHACKFLDGIEPQTRANLLAMRSSNASALGHREEARTFLAQAIDAFRSAGDKEGERRCIINRADMARHEGDFAASKALYAEVLRGLRPGISSRIRVVSLLSLAEAEYGLGNYAAALDIGRDALQAARESNNAQTMVCAMVNLVAYLCEIGQLREARTLADEAYALAVEKHYVELATLALQYRGLIEALSGFCEEAAPVLGYVDRVFAETGFRRGFTEQRGRDRFEAALKDAMGEDAAAAAIASGTQMAEDEALAAIGLA